MLLKRGVVINIKNNKDWTALHWAACRGKLAKSEITQAACREKPAKGEITWAVCGENMRKMRIPEIT